MLSLALEKIASLEAVVGARKQNQGGPTIGQTWVFISNSFLSACSKPPLLTYSSTSLVPLTDVRYSLRVEVQSTMRALQLLSTVAGRFMHASVCHSGLALGSNLW